MLPLRLCAFELSIGVPHRRTEFQRTSQVGVEGFVRNVQENIKSLGGGLELRQPDPAVANIDAAASEPASESGSRSGDDARASLRIC